ncbi:lipopolysaccharide biosynthesis protein [Roseinatronobacter alkalisoli]|uniref:Oligosaccharide flippase family protein n=1 Tax=Roseinatronobacter alkalisoli TaxID=3028235 RepID=A0ABT5TA34_9RHOB|nr:oligosaccharide flippase family protein [Roseinatronobacter sp. HJB301]MDD7971977.1 oligosaccharide flippase family protein [Roseinatronobacter sp. HJB301]
MPDRSSLRTRISARLFGGASGGVFRGMVTLALGSGIGRIIGIASIPVLTRLYSPEDFGVLAVFTALVAILAPLVTLRYALALPLPRHDGIAMNLLVLSTGLMLGLTGFFALTLWLWGAPLLALVSMQVLAPWWWLIALGVLGTAAYELLTMWATRRRAYKVIAQTNVTQSAAGALVKIGLGLAALQPLGLLVGQVIAQTGGVGRLISGFQAEMRANWRHVSVRRMRAAAWRHRGFPIWRVPSQFLMVFSMQAPMLAFAVLYDKGVVGQLALAFSVIVVPVSLLGQTTSQAYYAEISKLGPSRPKSILLTMKSTLSNMLWLSLVPTLIIFFGGGALFAFILGAAWLQSGEFAQILSIFMLTQLLNNPISRTFSVLGMESRYFLMNAQRAALTISSFTMSYFFAHDPFQTLILYVALTSAHRILVILYIFLTLRSRIRQNAHL